MKDLALPTLVAHADWSCGNLKRWMAFARLGPEGCYQVGAPQPVGQAQGLLQRLREIAGEQGNILAGFDFPIGLPLAYAQNAGIKSFLSFLVEFDHGSWPQFDQPARKPGEISLGRPFYPDHPGMARQQHLLAGLVMDHMDQLRRVCERSRSGRRAAAPLFWTMGGQQVGKAALNGWRQVLGPAVVGSGGPSSEKIGVWPFSGMLCDLLGPGRMVLVETYPAECYLRIGVAFPRPHSGHKTGKRVQRDRSDQARALIDWAVARQVLLEPELQAQVSDGFGPGVDGEDRFDAVAGLLGMLDLLLSGRRDYEPEGRRLRAIEGWIFGMPVPEDTV